MKDDKKVAARYRADLKDECSGELTITGVKIPCNRGRYNPLDKIWASVKKKVLEEHGVHISATFKYNINLIVCDFFIDNAYGETAKLSKLVLYQRFERAFPYAIADFEDALEDFFKDEKNGYYAYVKLFESSKGKPDREECEEMFNTFLRKINLRNPVDEYSQEELEIIKEARKKRKEEKRFRKVKGALRKHYIENTELLYRTYGRALSGEEISKLAEIDAREHLRLEKLAELNREILEEAFRESFN